MISIKVFKAALVILVVVYIGMFLLAYGRVETTTPLIMLGIAIIAILNTWTIYDVKQKLGDE